MLLNLLQNLQDKAKSTLENPMIPEGVWLLGLNSELPFSSQFLGFAYNRTISYKISYFESEEREARDSSTLFIAKEANRIAFDALAEIRRSNRPR